MLNLAARAELLHDQPMRHRARYLHIQVLFHHAQGQVQAGGGPHGAVDDEDAVLLDTDLWIAILHGPCEGPIGGSPAPVEQTGRDQRKATGTDPRCAARLGAGQADEIQQCERRLDGQSLGLHQQLLATAAPCHWTLSSPRLWTSWSLPRPRC